MVKAFVLAALLLGCTPERTIDQDIATCRTICGARPVDDFGRGGSWESFTCRCGKLEHPPSPCPEAGAAARPRLDPW